MKNTIHGIILDSLDKSIPFVTIKIISKKYNRIERFSFGDSTGNFKIENISCSDTILIQASSIGLETKSLPLICDSVRNHFIKIRMNYLKGDLPLINVKSKIQFQTHKDTTKFYVESYRKNELEKLGELLLNIPGFEVNETGKISFKGKSISKVLLSGDDILKNDYAIITKNLSSNNINSIDVIENYKDPSDISKLLEKGGETVINLNFKQNKSLGIFGTTSLSGKTNFENYESKTDIVSLGKKSKTLVFENLNSLGQLASTLSGSTEKQSLNVENNGNVPTETSIIQFPKIVPSRYINESNFISNHSGMLNVSGRSRIGNFITSKNTVQYENDTYLETQSYSQNFLFQGQALNISRNEELNKSITKLNIFSENTFLTGKRIQTVISFGTLFNKENSFINSNTLSIPFVSNLYNNNHNNCFNASNTIIIDKTSIITTNFAIKTLNIIESLKVTPIAKDSNINLQNNYDFIEESVPSNKMNMFSFGANYSKRINSGLLKVSISLEKSKQQFVSSLNGYLSNQLPITIDSFQNNIKSNQNKAAANFSYSLQMGDQINLIGEMQLLRQSLELDDFQNIKKNATTNIFLLPTFTISFKTSDESKLNLSASSSASSAELKKILPEYVFINNTNVQKGNMGNLEQLPSILFSLNYNYFDLTKRKIIFVSGLIYNQKKNLVTSNIMSAQNFVKSNYVYFPNSDYITLLFSKIEKLIPHLKSRLIVNLSGYNRSGLSFYQNSKFNNHLYGYSGEVQFIYNNSPRTSFDIKTMLNSNISQTDGLSQNSIHSREFILNFTFNTQLGKRFFINLNGLYTYSNSDLSNNKFFLANTSVNFKPKIKNINLGLKIQNIFNNKAYSIFRPTAFGYDLNSFSVVNRLLLLNFTYSF